MLHNEHITIFLRKNLEWWSFKDDSFAYPLKKPTKLREKWKLIDIDLFVKLFPDITIKWEKVFLSTDKRKGQDSLSKYV